MFSAWKWLEIFAILWIIIAFGLVFLFSLLLIQLARFFRDFLMRNLNEKKDEC